MCGQLETKEHVLFECNRYGQERERWRGTIKGQNAGMCEYEVIQGYQAESEEIRKERMSYLRVSWNSRQRYERLRDYGLE